jgi:hypothetical protein
MSLIAVTFAVLLVSLPAQVGDERLNWQVGCVDSKCSMVGSRTSDYEALPSGGDSLTPGESNPDGFDGTLFDFFEKPISEPDWLARALSDPTSNASDLPCHKQQPSTCGTDAAPRNFPQRK